MLIVTFSSSDTTFMYVDFMYMTNRLRITPTQHGVTLAISLKSFAVLNTTYIKTDIDYVKARRQKPNRYR